MNHIADANKMVDTPRTDAAYAASTGAGIYELFKESQDIERELNAANQIIRQQQLLEEDNLRLTDKIHQLYEGSEEQKQRIKRLEDCAETAWGIIANVDSGSWQEQRADWREAATRWRDEQFHPELSERKAKEAKL